MQRKKPSKKRGKTQHDKFVALARESGADDGEAAFIAKVKAISSTKPKKKKTANK